MEDLEYLDDDPEATIEDISVLTRLRDRLRDLVEDGDEWIILHRTELESDSDTDGDPDASTESGQEAVEGPDQTESRMENIVSIKDYEQANDVSPEKLEEGPITTEYSPFVTAEESRDPTNRASTDQEPRTVSTTRIEIDGDDDHSGDTPVIYNWEENPGDTFGLPADATFAVSLDTATARTDSMAEAVDLILDEWVRLYCRHLCGFRDSGAEASLIKSVAESEHLRRTFRARAIRSLGTAFDEVPEEYEQTLSSLRSEIEARVGNIALEDGTLIAVRESKQEQRATKFLQDTREVCAEFVDQSEETDLHSGAIFR